MTDGEKRERLELAILRVRLARAEVKDAERELQAALDAATEPELIQQATYAAERAK